MNFLDWLLENYEDLTMITLIISGIVLLFLWFILLLTHTLLAVGILIVGILSVFGSLYSEYRHEMERNDE